MFQKTAGEGGKTEIPVQITMVGAGTCQNQLAPSKKVENVTLLGEAPF